LGSKIRDLDKLITDPGVKKAPDSETATLLVASYFHENTFPIVLVLSKMLMRACNGVVIVRKKNRSKTTVKENVVLDHRLVLYGTKFNPLVAARGAESGEAGQL
jgi:hypothetical protein